MPTLLLLSDTHGKHREVTLNGPSDWVDYHQTGITDPAQIDLLIHAGDIGAEGPEGIQVFLDFCRWLEALPMREKLFIGGNHDFMLERTPALSRHLHQETAPGCVYLQNEEATLAGQRIFASPVTEIFQYMAFNRADDARKELWGHIDPSVQVLVTHGPPKGGRSTMLDGRDIGDRYLAERLRALQREASALRLHVYGHAHSGYGVSYREGVLEVNAALCDEKNKLVNKPILISLP